MYGLKYFNRVGQIKRGIMSGTISALEIVADETSCYFCLHRIPNSRKAYKIDMPFKKGIASYHLDRECYLHIIGAIEIKGHLLYLN